MSPSSAVPPEVGDPSRLRIGVLASQGDFAAHAEMLRSLGADPVEVRTPDAIDGLDGLVIPGGESTTITKAIERDALERHLRDGPTRVSKSRIKRLRGLSQPQYRLRVGEVRVFYDVTREAVEVLAIVTKAEAARWLAEHATPSAPSGPG